MTVEIFYLYLEKTTYFFPKENCAVEWFSKMHTENSSCYAVLIRIIHTKIILTWTREKKKSCVVP